MIRFRLNTWVMANVFGVLVGIIFWIACGMATAGSGIGFGIGIGLLQWRALRKMVAQPSDLHAGQMWTWIGASGLSAALPGWLMFFAVIMGASNGGAPVRDASAFIGGVTGAVALFAGVSGFVFGIGAGAVQFRIVRAIWPQASGISWLPWVGTTAIGWGGSWALLGTGASLALTATAAQGALTPVLVVIGLVLLLGSWAFNGVLTGLVLASMSTEPAPDAPVPVSVIVS